MQPTTDRWKILYISRGDMLRLICGEIKIINIPDWSRLCECHEAFSRRGFDILIEHQSFPKVESGMEPEIFVAEFKETKITDANRKLTFD